MGLEEKLPSGILLSTVEGIVNWSRKSSLWPATFGLACCAIEMMSIVSSRYDIARFGMEPFRGSPRQADLLIVSGRVSNKMAAPLRQIYDQMLEPKWVIAMGACSSSMARPAAFSLFGAFTVPSSIARPRAASFR